MHIGLWFLQGLLALVFFASGSMKLLRSRKAILTTARMGWAQDFTAAQIKLVGLLEIGSVPSLVEIV